MKDFQLVRRQPVALGFRPAGGLPALDVEAVEREAGLGGGGTPERGPGRPRGREGGRRWGSTADGRRQPRSRRGAEALRRRWERPPPDPNGAAPARVMFDAFGEPGLQHGRCARAAAPPPKGLCLAGLNGYPNWELAPSVARCHIPEPREVGLRGFLFAGTSPDGCRNA